MPTPSIPEEEERRHEEKLAEAILKYLAEHPQASDTLEGIAEWWIMRQQIRVEATSVAKVLRQLTESGLLEEIGKGKNPRRYRLKVMERDRAPEEKRGILDILKRFTRAVIEKIFSLSRRER
ncbi:winged helix DNA-binding protein [candidate division KSB1 bacterium]|nr:winged helix DNA-binding protein [candidate division KSB1 bacterium]